MRKLPPDENADSKYEQTLEFMRQTLFIPKTIEEMIKEARKQRKPDFGKDLDGYKRELLRLNELANFE